MRCDAQFGDVRILRFIPQFLLPLAPSASPYSISLWFFFPSTPPPELWRGIFTTYVPGYFSKRGGNSEHRLAFRGVLIDGNPVPGGLGVLFSSLILLFSTSSPSIPTYIYLLSSIYPHPKRAKNLRHQAIGNFLFFFLTRDSVFCET